MPIKSSHLSRFQSFPRTPEFRTHYRNPPLGKTLPRPWIGLSKASPHEREYLNPRISQALD